MKHIRHFLLVLMLMCGFTASAENNYELVDSIQGGVILHCYGWTYDQIIDNLEDIAKAGFTAVQTSPVQPIDFTLEDNVEEINLDALYEHPIGLSLSYKGKADGAEFIKDEYDDETGNYEAYFCPLGTPSNLKTLCDSAHSFGILVIAEINANGLYYSPNSNENEDDYSEEWDFLQENLKGDSCWHNYTTYEIDESNRYSITYSDVDDLKDLASENEYVQQRVIDFLKELDSIGVDGIRWYQSRYISLPSEKFDDIEGTSNFWPAVTTNSGLDLYNYGVFTESPTNSDTSDSLMVEYVKYMCITDDEYGRTVIQDFAQNTAVTEYANWVSSKYNIPVTRIVYIPESSDTYYGDQAGIYYTGDISQNIADRTWAVLASRNDASALYFARPNLTKNTLYLGKDDMVNKHFTSPEVAQVNIFHNICNGEPDYFSSTDSVISICRESGAVLVLVRDSNKTVTALNGGGYTTAGTYTDKISGNTFTATDYYITGTIGSTGIAVLYSDSALLPRIILDPNGGEFTDAITVTINLNTIATSGTFRVGNGEEQTITDRTTVTIGEDISIGDSVTIYWTATDGTQTNSGSSTYIKIKTRTISICVQTSSGDVPYIYSWVDTNPVIEMSGEWPGSEMNDANYYVGNEKFFRKNFDNVSYINIIFNCNGAKQTSNITGINEDAFFFYNDVDSTYKILTPPAFLPDTAIENQPLYVYLVNNAYYDSLTVSIWDDNNNSFTDEGGDKLNHLVSTYNDYGTYYDVYKWNYDDSLTSTPTSLTFTGVKENKSMTTDTLKFSNGGWYSNAETWFGSQGKAFRTFQVIYDEETANGYYNTDSLSADEKAVMYSTLVREFDQSYWNTICMPFDVSADTITQIFGSGTYIAEFNSFSDATLYFKVDTIEVSTMKAGVPYLIKPGKEKVTNPVFYFTTINSRDTCVSVVKVDSIVNIDSLTNDTSVITDTCIFTGTYSPHDLDTLTDMFWGTEGLLHPIASGYTLKGLRAYITLLSDSTNSAGSRALTVSFEPLISEPLISEPLISTGINRVDTDDDNDADAAADIYNISGQKVNSDISTLPQGIYITRGRKFIIK